MKKLIFEYAKADNMSESVVFQLQPTAGNKRIGLARLNQEASLNAISLEMVKSLKAKLEEWKNDEQVVCVFLEGTGPKAFCAGGDVQALYKSAIENPGEACLHAEEFFNVEYRLDYLLHSYPKPVICWGQGIVMGGGLGLMAGCSHAVVTETTRVAMPEITIGLYPDVGGSWFLNRMPGKLGLFLALTGASINANDCLFAGLSRYALLSEDRDALLIALAELPWSNISQENYSLLDDLLEDFSEQSKSQVADTQMTSNSYLETHQNLINELCSDSDACHVVNRIIALETDDPWLAKARDSLKAGSPLSALVIYKQLERAKGLDLAEVFKSEYMLSTNVVRFPEFAEGVRALLIDKDRSPNWQFKRIEDVPSDLLEQLFTPPQSGSTWPKNPLSDIAELSSIGE